MATHNLFVNVETNTVSVSHYVKLRQTLTINGLGARAKEERGCCCMQTTFDQSVKITMREQWLSSALNMWTKTVEAFVLKLKGHLHDYLCSPVGFSMLNGVVNLGAN